jgi:hypothetical protein
MCTHDWQPIPNWYARYRCALCHVIGCKLGVVQAAHVRRTSEIVPYRCGARPGGVKCPEPAVHGSYGKNFRCAVHRHPARPACARSKCTVAPREGAQ